MGIPPPSAERKLLPPPLMSSAQLRPTPRNARRALPKVHGVTRQDYEAILQDAPEAAPQRPGPGRGSSAGTSSHLLLATAMPERFFRTEVISWQ